MTPTVSNRIRERLGRNHQQTHKWSHLELGDAHRDSQLSESYTYDGNSNRVAWTDPLGSGTATHDAQDRLLSDGTTSTYRSLSDQVGSVRFVVNTADGAVALALDGAEFPAIT